MILSKFTSKNIGSFGRSSVCYLGKLYKVITSWIEARDHPFSVLKNWHLLPLDKYTYMKLLENAYVLNRWSTTLLYRW